MSARTLGPRYAVRPRIVLKYFGQLSVVVALLAAVPLAVSLMLGDFRVAARYGVVIAVLLAGGLRLSRLRVSGTIQTNEAMVIAAGIFILTPVLMAYPIMASGLGFMDALFEAVSGATTTGLSTLATVEGKSGTFLFARAWMQWYGGLGIVVLSLVFVIPAGPVARRLSVTESEESDLVGGMRAHAHRVLLSYCILTAGGIALLWALSGDLAAAVPYTLSAVSTGGFAPHDASLAALPDWWTRGAVILLCLLGATPFVFYRRLLRNGWRELYRDVQLRAIILGGAVVSLVLWASLSAAGDLDRATAARHAVLMAFSAHTTAGFATLDVATFTPACVLALMLAMAVGGGVGSTAGGIKMLRLLVVLRVFALAIARPGMPKDAVVAPRLGGRRLEPEEIQHAVLLSLGFVATILVSWFAFLLHGYDPLAALFEVVSAVGTVGLSSGLTGPDLPTVLKAVLCADMLLGRLELIPLFVLFAPRTWVGERERAL